MVGAAPMGEDLAKQLLQRVPSTRFLAQRERQSSMEQMRGTLKFAVYGQTETIGTLMPILDRRDLYRRVGVPVSRTEVAIFDEQTGNTAKFGATGEVVNEVSTHGTIKCARRWPAAVRIARMAIAIIRKRRQQRFALMDGSCRVMGNEIYEINSGF